MEDKEELKVDSTEATAAKPEDSKPIPKKKRAPRAKKPAPESNKYTMTTEYDADTNVTAVKFDTDSKHEGIETIQDLINVTVQGFRVGLQQVLMPLQTLRPATELEKSNNLYVFYDKDKDNNMYNARNALYANITNMLNVTLGEIFPDVIYINGARGVQQDLILHMSEADAKAHNVEMSKVVADVIIEIADMIEKEKAK